MEYCDYAIIVQLSDDLAKKLNLYKGTDGLHIENSDCLSISELNNSQPIHSVAKSRVFFVKAIRGSSLDIVLWENKKTVKLPPDEEFVLTAL